MIKHVQTLILSALLFAAYPSYLGAEEAQARLRLRYQELMQEIAHHDRLYYLNSEPSITDREYDSLFQELTHIEENHPEWVTPESPSQKIGSDLRSDQTTSSHFEPMLSIKSIQTRKELRHFFEATREKLNADLSYSVEEKIDGIAVSLQYERGTLKKGLTRGNGLIGNDITNHIKKIKSVPRILNEPFPELIEIRGEIFISKKNFYALNQNREVKYQNPRNAAAGILHAHINESQLGLLNFIPHSLGFVNNPIPKTQTELLARFDQFGFIEKLNSKHCFTFNEIAAFISESKQNQSLLPYDIDGVVIKVNQFLLWDELGKTIRAPKSMVAYKFNSETEWTKVIGIIFQKGKKGRITPVALLEPIFIDGTHIERVSLLNLNIYDELDLQIGDDVLIEKRGRIIPTVLQVRPSLNRTPKIKINSCPLCHRSLTSGLYCDWEDCIPLQKKRL